MLDSAVILAFIGGILADLVRRIILPQSEQWLGRFFPQTRKAQNRDRNLLQLEVRERLQKLGHDPELAKGVEDESEAFARRLEDQRDAKRSAYVDAEVDVLTSLATSQVEMNEAAFDRFGSADNLLERRFSELVDHTNISQAARESLIASQEAWKKFRGHDSEIEALVLVEGGSMMPLIRASALESETIDRIGRLKTLQGYLEDAEGTYFANP